MAVEEVVMKWDRCDRCKSVMRVLNDAGKVVEVRAESKGAVVVEIGGKVLVEYENICPICERRLKKLVSEMGPVDRTLGGNRRPPITRKRKKK
jgi:hypothetical protein